jgi:hypothetical protein
MNTKHLKLLTLSFALACSASMSMAQTNSKQATEAAQKHQADKVTAAKAPAAKAAAPKTSSAAGSKPAGSVAQRLEACKKDASWNVVKREQCVWSLCKGRWGKQGCPAQATGKPTER